MTQADLDKFGLTPIEVYDAVCGASAYFQSKDAPEIPKISQTLNLMRLMVSNDFDITEQLKDRYN